MTGIIILAAGSSTRLGRPKQNLIFRGKTLLQNAIENALCSLSLNVIVVLGGNVELVNPTLQDQPVAIIYNPEWKSGMASSIKLGLSELLKIDPTVTSVIVMLCDQPFVDSNIINQLIEKKQTTKKSIVACAYNNTIGPPALFDGIYFAELLALSGNDGAKKLLLQHIDDVERLPFSLGAIDIDTVEDYERLAKVNP